MKIHFNGYVPVPHEELEKHMAHSRGLGLPYVVEEKPHGRRLAVVGGGPSIRRQLQEIGSYTDIWAINGACRFLRDNGIESTLVSVDAVDFLDERVRGAKKALLSTRTHPRVFDVLKDADIRIFDLLQDGGTVWASVSTALAIVHLAPICGYWNVDYFGCEGSFSDETHAYMDEAELRDFRFAVSCGGREYVTAPDLYLQTQALAEVMRTLKSHFSEKSGGLLRAMIQNEDHDIVKVSKQLMESFA